MLYARKNYRKFKRYSSTHDSDSFRPQTKQHYNPAMASLTDRGGDGVSGDGNGAALVPRFDARIRVVPVSEALGAMSRAAEEAAVAGGGGAAVGAGAPAPGAGEGEDDGDVVGYHGYQF